MKAAAVNRESQTKLAKLLAKENIRVCVGNYHTAFFDIKKRILGLPTWNVDNKNVSDLLIGHEVGHALYTPSDAIDRFKTELPNVPFDIGNIVEDIRIERMIKNNYPGLVHSFKQGYSYFVQKDFFKIAGQDLEDLGFADRLNIHAKIGEFVNVPFNAEETNIYNRCIAAQTYDDVLILCKEIAAYVDSHDDEKQKQPQTNQSAEDSIKEDSAPQGGESASDDGKQTGKQADTPSNNKDSSDTENSQPSNGSSEESDNDDDASDSDGTAQQGGESADDDNTVPCDDKDNTANDGESQKESAPPQKSQTQRPKSGADNKELTSATQRNIEDNLKSLQAEAGEYPIANAPRVEDMMRSVISVEEVMEDRRTSMPAHYEAVMNADKFNDVWKEFKKTTAKNISVLVNEFERRKAAYQYSRARTSDTGAINVNRLHAYKFEDNIFKSVTSLADAKNHGMMFFIDYSGSMRNTIGRVIDQTLQLVYFCKAVGIPFEVYGFTSIEAHYAYNASTQPDRMQDMTPKDTLPGLSASFENTMVFQLIHSSLDKKQFDLACRELKAQTQWGLANKSYGASNAFPLGGRYELLNGTPLHETVIIAHELVKRFKSKHNIQKTNVVFLTDGDGNGLRWSADTSAKSYEKKTAYSSKVVLPLYGRNIIVDHRDRHMYAKLIENLKVTCGVTTIGFFIAEYKSTFKNNCIAAMQYQGKNIITWANALERFNPQKNTARRDKCFTVMGGFNFDAYFIFDADNNLTVNSDEEFQSDCFAEDTDYTSASSQNKIAKAFTKFATDKKSNRVFLSKFAEIIA